MANLYQSKEIEQLEKRIQELEDKLNKQSQSLSMFGRSYSQVGSSNSDFLIKTKGQIKIQWGNKFIDLIKDGKVNVDSKVIYKQKEVGQKDGIYVIGEGDSVDVVLVVGGQQLDLKGNMGTTYVSFLEEQETTSESKSLALRNIGFLYPSIEEVTSNSIRNGIIYVENQQKLYIVKDGSLFEYSIEIPNPYTKQFVIAKIGNDGNEGALVIRGAGKQNSIAFDSMYLYTSTDGSYIDSDGEVYIKIGGINKALIGQSKVVFSDTVYSQRFYSKDATNSYGFRLFVEGGVSTLEVDNLIVRKRFNNEADLKAIDTPQKWYFNNNIIEIAQEPEEEIKNQLAPSLEQPKVLIKITLLYNNSFKVGDNLYIYSPLQEGNNEYYNVCLMAFKILKIDEYLSNVIYIGLQPTYTDEVVLSMLPSNIDAVISSLSQQTLFSIGNSSDADTKSYIPKISKCGFQIIESQSFEDEKDIQKVVSRVGDLTELELKYRDKEEVLDVEGSGMYSKLAVFKEAKYVHDYDLPVDDNSSKFASTEWVNKIMPVGSIIMFGAQSAKIPEGWHICDGTNGTPNLVGRFIKAVGSDSGVGAIASELNENNELTLSKKHLPKHSHPHKPHSHTMQENTSEVTTSSSGDLTVSFNWSDYNWGLSTSSVSVIDSVSGDGVSSTSTSVNSVSGYSTQGGSATGGSHTHTVSLRGTNPTINQSTSQEDTLSDSDWPNNPIKIEPRAYALIFIMRIK